MSIEEMKQALEALELEDMAWRYEKEPTPEHIAKAITSLRQAIEQAEKQEPVAYINVEQRKLEWAKYTKWDTPTVVNLPKIPLYTTPQPQREWVDLTDKEINKLRYKKDWTAPWTDMTFAHAIEAKLKQKNGYAEEKNT
jgi:hypothetical protein